jgi:hypothetical protein
MWLKTFSVYTMYMIWESMMQNHIMKSVSCERAQRKGERAELEWFAFYFWVGCVYVGVADMTSSRLVFLLLPEHEQRDDAAHTNADELHAVHERDLHGYEVVEGEVHEGQEADGEGGEQRQVGRDGQHGEYLRARERS